MVAGAATMAAMVLWRRRLAARGREVSVILLCERDICRAMRLPRRKAGSFRCCRSIRRRSASPR